MLAVCEIMVKASKHQILKDGLTRKPFKNMFSFVNLVI